LNTARNHALGLDLREIFAAEDLSLSRFEDSVCDTIPVLLGHLQSGGFWPLWIAQRIHAKGTHAVIMQSQADIFPVYYFP
jgi:hypothetical protein